MSRMFLYLLEVKDGCGGGYDSYYGHVVRAASSYEARKLANGRSANEGAIWDDPKRTSCRRIGEVTPGARTTPGVVLSDFNAG